MSEFWQKLFKLLEIELLVSTVYHSQTDNQSERTNQTAEIALQFFITSHSLADWSMYLLRLWAELNRMKNAFTELSSDEIIYEFKLQDSLTLLQSMIKSDTDFTSEQRIAQQEAQKAVTFANYEVKIWYDKHHCLLALEIRDEVFIKLYKRYILSVIINWKFFNQWASPVKVLKKIELLIYKLDIFSNWKIHSVILIAQLKLASKSTDLYNRENHSVNSSVISEFNEKWQNYEVKKLMSHWTRKLEHKKINKYLVHWKEWFSIHDT